LDYEKARVFLEIEVEINKDNPSDKGLSFAEIADFACGGIVMTVKDAIARNARPSKLLDARYEFIISKKCG